MKRTNFFIPIPLLTRLREYSKQSGLSLGELARRAIEEFLDRKGDKQ